MGAAFAAEPAFTLQPPQVAAEGYSLAGRSPIRLTLRPFPLAITEDYEAETKRAFAQEREADVVVFYDDANELRLWRPKRKQPFASEAELLAYLTERKEAKRLLVVILSKRHEYSDPKQTIDGFWRACRKSGFEQVVIQQAHSSGRPILRE
jgi:hypothetical protein